MACMEHGCEDCDFFTMNNNYRNPKICPVCGGRIIHTWDEVPDED